MPMRREVRRGGRFGAARLSMSCSCAMDRGILKRVSSFSAQVSSTMPNKNKGIQTTLSEFPVQTASPEGENRLVPLASPWRRYSVYCALIEVEHSGDRFRLKLITAVSPRRDMRFQDFDGCMNKPRFFGVFHEGAPCPRLPHRILAEPDWRGRKTRLRDRESRRRARRTYRRGYTTCPSSSYYSLLLVARTGRGHKGQWAAPDGRFVANRK